MCACVHSQRLCLLPNLNNLSMSHSSNSQWVPPNIPIPVDIPVVIMGLELGELTATGSLTPSDTSSAPASTPRVSAANCSPLRRLSWWAWMRHTWWFWYKTMKNYFQLSWDVLGIPPIVTARVQVTHLATALVSPLMDRGQSLYTAPKTAWSSHVSAACTLRDVALQEPKLSCTSLESCFSPAICGVCIFCQTLICLI